MPLYFGAFPPAAAYAKPKEVQQPVILDWDIAHPLMQYIRDLQLVYVARAEVVDLPPGAKSLIDSNQGPLAFIAPREGYTDTVVTFPLIDGTSPNTTWFRYISFPLFILNSIQALGNVREGAGEELAIPGRPVALHAETASRVIKVTSSDGKTVDDVSRSPQGTFIYNKAGKAGVYERSGSPRACSHLLSIYSTYVRATWPHAGWCPRSRRKVVPSLMRSRLATIRLPAPRNRLRSRRTVVVAGARGTRGVARGMVYLQSSRLRLIAVKLVGVMSCRRNPTLILFGADRMVTRAGCGAVVVRKAHTGTMQDESADFRRTTVANRVLPATPSLTYMSVRPPRKKPRSNRRE